MPSWRPDPGWAGDWKVPRLLTRPITETERSVLVSLSCDGFGPSKIVKSLDAVDEIGELTAEHKARCRAKLADLAKRDVRAIVPSDDEYPDELTEIAAPPPVLYVRGERLDQMEPRVAIVGARACTSGAARFAHRLGEAFAHSGFTVVSGLARGVDAAAHHGALVAGRTIAVLGTGLDVCYPPEHRGLVRRVVASGAIVSEFPPGIGPRAWHFPARNRIIAGLVPAVIVVEAGTSSGALITAGFAEDHGRQVLACTTGPENPAGAGVRALLREGADLVVDAEQAVEIVADLVGAQLDMSFTALPPDEVAESLDGDARLVYEAVLDGSSTDEIVQHSDLEPARVSVALSELELEGLVEFGGDGWRRTEVRAWRRA